MQFKKYLVFLSVYSSIIALIAAVLFSTVLKDYYLEVFPFVILFFYLTTIIVHNVLIKAASARPAKFTALFMGSVSIKLFLYMIFLIIYVLIDKANAKSFIITFFILYVLFMTFDTYLLLNDVTKSENKK